MKDQHRARILSGLLATALGASFGIGTTARAAEASDTQVSSVGEVVVTAQRREEKLQDVPISVSVFSSQALEKRSVRDIQDLAGAVPTLVVAPLNTTPGGALVWLRGFGIQNPEKTNDPPVAVYIDGVYLGTNTAAMIENFDFERIEVLQGAQGTLYGKNSTAGAINITRTIPHEDHVTGKAALTLGSYDRVTLQGTVSAPLIQDKLWFKVSGMLDRDDGPYRNTTNSHFQGNKDFKGGSFTLHARPSDALDVVLTYDRIVDDSQPTPAKQQFVATALNLPIFTPTGPLKIGPYIPCTKFGICAQDVHNNIVNDNGPISSYYYLNALTSNVTFHLPSFDLVSTTSYRKSKDDVLVDFDGTPVTFFNTNRFSDYKQTSQELRIVSIAPSRLSYVGGLYYFKSEAETVQDVAQDTAYFSAAGTPGTIIYRGYRWHQNFESYAAYLQLDYKLTDDLKLTVGARYTKDKKDFILGSRKFTDQYFAGETLSAGPWPGKYSAEAFTPKVGLDYHFSPHSMVYVSYARGYNAGGFNPGATSQLGIGPYSAEKVKDIELGAKTDLLDGRLRVNANAFHIIYNDKQVSIVSVNPATNVAFSRIANAGNEEVNGLELDVTAIPIRGLTLNTSLGYLDAKYTEFTAALQAGAPVTDNTTLTPPRSPKFTIDASIDYNFPLGAGDMTLGAQYRWQDRYQIDALNSPQGWVSPGSMVDASVAYHFQALGGRDLTVTLFGKNLTNRIYPLQFTQAGAFLTETAVGVGRTWGVTLAAKFD